MKKQRLMGWDYSRMGLGIRTIRGWFLGVMAAAGIVGGVPRANAEELKVAAGAIRAEGILKHVRVLASDEFEGRAPGGVGEEKTVRYLVEQFKSMGLKPGNPDGTYMQQVPMVGATATTELKWTGSGGAETLQTPQDFVAWAPRFESLAEVQASELVFVGYGVVAPEYGWDDYKGVDVRGKTLVMLVNDPPIPDPKDPSQLDATQFKGKAMTYYGRWTYKYEIAAQKGAAAAIVIHETGPAGYPYFVVVNSWGRENFGLKPTAGMTPPVMAASWISLERARKLFADTGKDFEALKRDARTPGFRPIPLGVKADFKIRSQVREIESRNVVALLEGSDPKLRNEFVVLTAHWDHLGRDPKLTGDQVYNGAVDNASGTAALLQLAEAFTKLTPRPKRSIVFLAVTGEEQGLLGAKYYASHPLYPLNRTLANINIDGLNLWGRAKDVVIVGRGSSTLEDILEVAARSQDRVIRSDAEPEKGFYYRSDHFEFAKVGVPALYLHVGTQFIGQSSDFGMKKRAEYTEKDYHKVSDEVKADWDFSGGVEDTRLLMEVAVEVANGDAYPSWKDGSEFKAIRERSLGRGPR